MSASTGTKKTIPFTIGAAALPGQGSRPELVTRVSFSDLDAYPTVWTEISNDVRSFSTSRGGDSEQPDVDAGTATAVVSNSDRQFDPTFNSAARPMNQLWLLEQFSGETNSIFKGYVESYDQEWNQKVDPVATITAADEFKVLALDALPVMNPPQDSYEALVMYDQPDGYWRFNDPVETNQVAATAGSALMIANSITPISGTAIVGDNGGPTGTGSYQITNGARVFAPEENSEGVTGDVTGLAEMTIEMWVVIATKPLSLDYFALGPSDGTEEMYRIGVDSSGRIDFFARDASANTYEFTGTSLIPGQNYRHVVCTITDNYLRIYVDGVQQASMNWSSVFGTIDPAGSSFKINEIANARTYVYDEVAFYRHGLTADRVLAHYQAGALRGLASRQAGNASVFAERVGAILDTVGNQAPRNIQTSTRGLRAIFFKGQSPLDELRECVRAELIDGTLFVANDGTVTFLNNNHNSASPYTDVQMVFGDGGGTIPNQRPYVDVDFDYSDSFITNEVNAARETGTLQTRSDAFSISRYGKRSQTVSDLKVFTDVDADAIAQSIVGRYKAPQFRVLSLGLVTADPDLVLETFRLDLGSRIRLIRTVNVGVVQRDLFVKKIDIAGGPDGLWSVKLGVTDATVTLGPAVDVGDFDALQAAYPTFDEVQVAETF